MQMCAPSQTVRELSFMRYKCLKFYRALYGPGITPHHHEVHNVHSMRDGPNPMMR